MKAVINVNIVLIFFVFVGCPKIETDEQAVADALDEEYKAAIQDPNLFSKIRKGVLKNCISSMERTLKSYENNLDSNEHIDQVITSMKNTLSDMKDGSIHDGIPRLIEAVIVKFEDPPLDDIEKLIVRWASSDFDTNAIVFSNSQGTIKHFPFLGTEEDYLYKYTYIHSLRGHYQTIDDINPNVVRNIEVEKKIESVFEKIKFEIPGTTCDVWIEDADGNQSNKLPLIFWTEKRGN